MYVPNVEIWGIKSVNELLEKEVPRQEIVAVAERDFFKEQRVSEKGFAGEMPRAAVKEFRLFMGDGLYGKGMVAAFWGGRQIAASGVTIPDKIRQNATAPRVRRQRRRQRIWLEVFAKEPSKVFFAEEGGVIIREFELVCGGVTLSDAVYREWWKICGERENEARLAAAELGSKIPRENLSKLLSKEARFRLD